jgi:hypothetical protein
VLDASTKEKPPGGSRDACVMSRSVLSERFDPFFQVGV